jgi:hypothetical protein
MLSPAVEVQRTRRTDDRRGRAGSPQLLLVGRWNTGRRWWNSNPIGSKIGPKTAREGGALDPSQAHRIVAATAKRAEIKGNVSAHWLGHARASHA